MGRSGPRKRDHKKEYARRIERALDRGLTRSQARGHPGAGLAYISQRDAKPKRVVTDGKLEAAIKAVRNGESMSGAAKRLSVSRERLSAYAKQYAGAKLKGQTWTFNDTRKRQVPILAKGHLVPVITKVVGHEPASLAGKHYNESLKALADQRLFPAFEAKWSDVSVTDSRGRQYTFSSDANHLYRLIEAGEVDWTRIYHVYMQ